MLQAGHGERVRPTPNLRAGATLLTFLFESRSASAWFVLSIGLALLGGMIGALRELKPT